MVFAMTPNQRKLGLVAHAVFSVGLFGSISAFLALSVAGLFSQDAQTVRDVYPAMDLISRFVIIPLAFFSLLSGIVQALGTPWGVFRHYWIVSKLTLTAFAVIVLLGKIELIGYAARLAKQEILPRALLHTAGLQLVVHATGGLMVFLVPVVLSVYKPGGLTPFGRRQGKEPHKPSQPYSQPSRSFQASGSPGGKSLTVTIRRPAILAFIVFVAAVHLVIFHLATNGLGYHASGAKPHYSDFSSLGSGKTPVIWESSS